MSSRARVWAAAVCVGIGGLLGLWLFGGGEPEPEGPVSAPRAGGSRAPTEPGPTPQLPAAPQTGSGGGAEQLITLSGVVIDESGAPVKGAKVFAVGGLQAMYPGLECMAKAWIPMMPGMDFVSCGCSDNAEALKAVLPLKETPPVLATAETDAEGRWQLPVVPQRQVASVHARHGTLAASGAATDNKLVLAPRSTFDGRVVDDDGRPVAGASVWIIDDAVTELVTGEKGTFTSQQTDGPKRVIAFREGSLPDMKLASSRPDWRARRAMAMGLFQAASTDVTVELTVAAAIELRGRVLHRGKGLDGVEVTQTMAPCAAKAITDGDGNFVMRQMREQRYAIEARKGSLSAKLAVSSSRQPIVMELEELVVVEGTVTRDDGVPVRATLRAKQAGAQHPQATTSTKDDGTYSFKPMSEGEWTISVECDTAARVEQTVRIARPSAHVDFVLERGVVVKGRIVGSKGEPVPGSFLRIYDGVVTDSRSMPMSYRPPVKVEPDGTFEAQGLKDGEQVTFSVMASGWDEQLVPVKAPRSGVGIVLKRSARLHGVVRTKSGALDGAATVNAVVLDENGKPGTHSYGGVNTKGRYELAGLQPGKYEVVARSSSRTAKLTVAIPPEGDVTADLELPDAASISGIVVDEAGRAVAEAIVTTSNQPARFARPSMPFYGGRYPGMPAPNRSGPDGRFRLDDLSKEADVTVFASKAGYETTGAEGVRPGETAVRIVLKETGVVTGRVLGDRGALNRFTANGELQESSDGRFRVDRGKGSTVELDLSAEGYASHRRMVELPPQGSIDVGDVKLSRGVTIGGRVVDSAHKPVGSVMVQALAAKEKSAGYASSDEGGRFFLDALPDEDLTLSVRADGFKPLKRPVPRGSKDVELVLDRGFQLSGRVIDQDGKPMTGVRVTWTSKPAGNGMFVSDEQGRFTIGGLNAGELELRPWELDRGARYVPKTKVMVESPAQTIELRGTSGGVTVRVKTALFGAKLEVRGEGAPRDGRVEGGEVVFRSVPPGSHRLVMRERVEPIEVGSTDRSVTIDEH